MLGKLFKYENAATARILLPFYGAMALLTGIVIGFYYLVPRQAELTLPSALFAVTVVLFVLGLLAVCIVTFCLSLMRFYKNLLSDEGYLTHTLPVTTSDKIIAHTLTSVIWMILSIVVVGALLILLFTSIEPVRMAEFWRELASVFRVPWPPQHILALVEFVLISLIGVATLYLQFFTALSVGASISNGKHKILYAVLVYVIIYVVRNLVGTVLLLLPPLSYLMRESLPMFLSGNSSINWWLGFIFLYELAAGAIYYCLIYFSLKKRLNL